MRVSTTLSGAVIMALAAVVLAPGLASAQSTSRLVTQLQAGKHQTVVVYGTSLTAVGAWVKEVTAALEQRYPGLAKVVNSGGSGCWSQWGVSNLDARVLNHKPDLVTIEFGVNDAVARFHCSLAQSRTNLETMISRILAANPECEIVLLTTSPADAHPVGHTSHRQNIADYYELYRQVAKARHLAVVDLYPQWLALQKSDKETFARYVPDSIHPSAEGCSKVVTPAVLKTFGLAP